MTDSVFLQKKETLSYFTLSFQIERFTSHWIFSWTVVSSFYDSSFQLDPLSLHGGCPVLNDTPKWGANLWIWLLSFVNRIIYHIL